MMYLIVSLLLLMAVMFIKEALYMRSVMTTIVYVLLGVCLTTGGLTLLINKIIGL
jgi:hypothetical protein